MKNKTRIILTAVMIIAICIIILSVITNVKKQENEGFSDSEIVVNNVNTGLMIIDEKTTYQTMNGFGVSSLCLSDIIKNGTDAQEILTLLFSRTDGIGLNIYRYVLGAGSTDDDAINKSEMRTESFYTDNNTCDFTKDASARNCLSIANDIAGNNLRVVLCAFSPPIQLTKNNKAYNDAPGSPSESPSSNLSPENYAAYGNYLYECAEFFISEGYRVTGVSPVNEPQYSWRASMGTDGNITAEREGCYYSPEELRDLYTVLVNIFSKNNDVRLLLFESGEADGSDSVFAEYLNYLLSDSDEYKDGNRNIRNYFDTISIHSYWSSTEKKQQCADFLNTSYPGLSTACTEYSQRINDGNTGVLEYIVSEGSETRGLSIEYGLAMADIIITDLTTLHASEWCWWKGCSWDQATDALIYTNKDDPSVTETSKRLWCLGNFSKFIHEGAIRLAASSGNDNIPCVVFKNTDGSCVAVFLNNTDSDLSTEMTEILRDKTPVAYLTDETHNIEIQELILDSILTIPAKSVVTVVF